MAVADQIREMYPSLAFLMNDPEVGRLLRDAVDPNRGFSPQAFQAKLYETRWWKSRSAEQRQWEITRHTDRGSANRMRHDMRAQVLNLSRRVGVKLSSRELQFIAEVALQRGQTIDSPEVMNGLLALRRKPGHAAAGDVRTFARNAQAVASGEYFMPMSNRNAALWGERMVKGTATEESMRSAVADRAAKLYPHLEARIKAGETMQDMFDAHIQTIAEELELDPNKVDLSNSRWAKVIRVREEGNDRPMTLSETRTMAREDPRFWKTSKGKAMDAGMATSLARIFGRRA